MGQFRHQNVVTMYGVVKDGEPVSMGYVIITECSKEHVQLE